MRLLTHSPLCHLRVPLRPPRSASGPAVPPSIYSAEPTPPPRSLVKMPIKTVYKAQVDHLQILDEDGRLDEKLAKDLLSDDDVIYMYEQMTIGRNLDEVAFKLQRSGRMGTYPQNKGQEAAAIASGFAAQKGVDFLVPCY